MFFPPVCPGCDRRGVAPCAECVAQLGRPPDAPPPLGLDAVVALFAFEGIGSHLIKAIKYANHRDALRWMSVGLAALVPPGADVVTWVPTTTGRRRTRGYDQGELIARLVARHLGVPCRALLRRTDDRSQTGSSLDERRRGPALTPRGSSAHAVLLVDDVRTTGASLSAAATTLRVAGARFVVGATLAATPAARSSERCPTNLASGASGTGTVQVTHLPPRGELEVTRADSGQCSSHHSVGS